MRARFWASVLICLPSLGGAGREVDGQLVHRSEEELCISSMTCILHSEITTYIPCSQEFRGLRGNADGKARECWLWWRRGRGPDCSARAFNIQGVMSKLEGAPEPPNCSLQTHGLHPSSLLTESMQLQKPTSQTGSLNIAQCTLDLETKNSGISFCLALPVIYLISSCELKVPFGI